MCTEVTNNGCQYLAVHFENDTAVKDENAKYL
jgi:hypothetical protein